MTTDIRTNEAVAHYASALLTTKLSHIKVVGSLVVGAAVPDLVIAACFPEVFAFTNGDALDAHILAYLRAVRGGVRLSTIAQRIDVPEDKVDERVQKMVAADAIRLDGGLYYIAFAWRHILPEVVAIDTADDAAGDWRIALARAARNHAFAHRTFIALPAHTAETVRQEPAFRELSTGLLAVAEAPEEGAEFAAVTSLVNIYRAVPSRWLDYYSVALTIARRFGGK